MVTLVTSRSHLIIYETLNEIMKAKFEIQLSRRENERGAEEASVLSSEAVQDRHEGVMVQQN
jgi:hypothetical protein